MSMCWASDWLGWDVVMYESIFIHCCRRSVKKKLRTVFSSLSAVRGLIITTFWPSVVEEFRISCGGVESVSLCHVTAVPSSSGDPHECLCGWLPSIFCVRVNFPLSFTLGPVLSCSQVSAVSAETTVHVNVDKITRRIIFKQLFLTWWKYRFPKTFAPPSCRHNQMQFCFILSILMPFVFLY